jgi:uncharacterized protein DUF4350
VAEPGAPGPPGAPGAPGAPQAAGGGPPPAGTVWLRPAVILPALAVVLVMAILWTPESGQVDQESRLTTYSTSARSASGFYEVAQRLGWPTRRLTTPLRAPLDTDAVYAELGPSLPLSRRESGVLLDAVRRGAGLVYVVSRGDALEDSLPVRRSDSGYSAAAAPAGAAGNRCSGGQGPGAIWWFQNGVHLYRLMPRRPLPADTAVFVQVTLPDSSGAAPRLAPAALGFPLGAGRVVVLSDPDLLRNDVIRVCKWGVGPQVVEALEWVSRGRRPRLVFDEYHQGFGLHPGPWRATVRFLQDAPLGNAIAQAAIAGLILLLAVGARPIAPRGVPRVERRSPLEHVDALARAYEQVGATRTVARRLARGLRRRHGRGAWSARPAVAGSADADERFLTAVAGAHPALAPDATRLLDAEHRVGTPADVLAVADAVDRIDQVFSPSKP